MGAIDPRFIIEEFLDSHDLEYERKDTNTFLVTLPGGKEVANSSSAHGWRSFLKH